MKEEKKLEVIKRFLSNESDYVEADRMAEYLLAHPELLDEHVLFNEEVVLPSKNAAEKRKILNGILNPRRISVIAIKRLVVAASLAGLIALGITWLLQSKKETIPSQTAIADNLIRIKNTTTFSKAILLPDSSVLQLEPQAEIAYATNFNEKRDIFLNNGDVYFEVHRNEKAPFSVYAKGIKTTALGTAFWVQNPTAAPTVTVQLTHGKVVLVSTELSFNMNDVVLAPGQTCYINKNTGEVKVTQAQKQLPTTALKQPDHLATTENTTGNKTVLWTNDGVQFSKAELKNVLTQLEARYNVIIIADEKVVKDVVLTGKLYATDSLHPILKSICDMNRLYYEIRNDSIFLKKK